MMQRNIKHHTAQGFILAEVLIAILLTLILTGISMGVVVMATAVKVHGDELSDATRWIQEDIEDIKIKANGIDAVDANATPIQYTNTTLTKCQASDTSNGYGSLLMTQSRPTSLNGATIASSATFTKTSSSGTRTYNLVRTAVVPNTAPYNVLQISYSVNKTSGTVISNSYAEVIPGASFYCKPL